MARTQAGLEELDDAIQKSGGPPATLVPLDLRDGAALDRLGPSLADRFEVIDGFVHAAGSHHGLAPLWDVTPITFDTDFTVNVVAGHRLIRALHPLLAKSDSANAVFVTDATPPDPPAYWGTYAAAKAALEALASAYAAEARPAGVRVRVFDPGPMGTRLRTRAFPGESPDQSRPPDLPAKWLVDHLAAVQIEDTKDIRLVYRDFDPDT